MHRNETQDECDSPIERVLELAEQHVIIAAHILSFFASRATAYRTLSRLKRDRRLRSVGRVMLQATGNSHIAYCNGWKPKRDQLRHEVLITDFLLAYPEATIVRGWQVDQRIRPDAQMTITGELFNVELDTGHESHTKVAKRQLAYIGDNNFLLYVTLSTRRLRGLVKHSERVRNIALFTTLRQAVADPHGEIWIDAFGNSAAI